MPDALGRDRFVEPLRSGRHSRERLWKLDNGKPFGFQLFERVHPLVPVRGYLADSVVPARLANRVLYLGAIDSPLPLEARRLFPAPENLDPRVRGNGHGHERGAVTAD